MSEWFNLKMDRLGRTLTTTSGMERSSIKPFITMLMSEPPTTSVNSTPKCPIKQLPITLAWLTGFYGTPVSQIRKDNLLYKLRVPVWNTAWSRTLKQAIVQPTTPLTTTQILMKTCLFVVKHRGRFLTRELWPTRPKQIWWQELLFGLAAF